jgi:hypothetical protein
LTRAGGFAYWGKLTGALDNHVLFHILHIFAEKTGRRGDGGFYF